MSYEGRFMFASGISKTLRVPKGTLQGILGHLAHVERTLGFQPVQYKNGSPRWEKTEPTEGVSDEDYCDTVLDHNALYHRLWEQLGQWSAEPVKGGERLTPKQAHEFWGRIVELRVPPSRWTERYYRETMEALYDVMRGRTRDGILWNTKPLTIPQAEQVIEMFSTFLDPEDMRLAVCKGEDSLTSGDDYSWSSTCGAIAENDFDHHGRHCRKRGCEVRDEWLEERGEAKS